MVTAALLVILLLHLVAWRFPSNWMWGVAVLHAWPPAGASLLALVAALGFLPPIGRGIDRGLARLGALQERAGRPGDVLIAGAMAFALFLLRDPLRFTGDSALRMGQLELARPIPGLLEHVYPLDLLLNFSAPRAIATLGIAPADALQLVTAIVGGCYAFVGLGFLRAIGARRASLAAGTVALFSGGTLLHFAGYGKFGPLLLGIAIAAWGAAEIALRNRGPWGLALGVAIAVLSHRSGYLLVPAAAWVLIAGYRSAAPGRRPAFLAAGAGLTAALVVMLPRSLELVLHFDRAVHLPGGNVAHARLAVGAPPLLLKLSDALNVLGFLAPLWLAAAAAALARHPPPGPARGSRGLGVPGAIALAAFSLILLGVEPGGGWARDWDVATGCGALAAFASAYVLVGSWGNAGRAAAVPLALALTLAAWGIHVDAAIGMRRVATLATGRPALSDPIRAGLCDFLGTRELNAGHPAAAADWFQQAIMVGGPNPRLVHQSGIAYLRAGDLPRARAAFMRAAASSPAVAGPWVGLSRVALLERDTLAAIAALDSALTRDPGDAADRDLVRALREARPAP
jgi:hypothetical protein